MEVTLSEQNYQPDALIQYERQSVARAYDSPPGDMISWAGSPWPLSGIPTDNGFVLLRTETRERSQYRKVGMFAVERDDPIWREGRNKTMVFVV
jgi:hypothetical protein